MQLSFQHRLCGTSLGAPSRGQHSDAASEEDKPVLVAMLVQVKMAKQATPSSVIQAFHDSFGVVYERLLRLAGDSFSDVLLVHVLQQVIDSANQPQNLLPNYVVVDATDLYDHWHTTIRAAKAMVRSEMPRCKPVDAPEL